jgi:hypothetical protein
MNAPVKCTSRTSRETNAASYSAKRSRFLSGCRTSRYDRRTPGTGNNAFFLNDALPKKVPPGFPFRAIRVPRISGRSETTIEPSTPIAALKALAPSTLLQLPGDGKETMTNLSALVRRIPAYTLNAGTQMRGISQRVEALLKDLCGIAQLVASCASQIEAILWASRPRGRDRSHLEGVEARSARTPAPCTGRPSTRVARTSIVGISSSGTVSGSPERTIKSASFPGSIEPSFSSMPTA